MDNWKKVNSVEDLPIDETPFLLYEADENMYHVFRWWDYCEMWWDGEHFEGYNDIAMVDFLRERDFYLLSFDECPVKKHRKLKES